MSNEPSTRYEFESPRWSSLMTVGVVMSVLVLVGILVLVLWPSRGHDFSWRGVCAANLRGITQSMNVYAADNSDQYPIMPYAPYRSGLNAAHGTSTGSNNPDAALQKSFADAGQAGSVQACMWIMVLAGQVSPKQFICGESAFTSPASVETKDKGGNYFNNFQNSKQLSYSMAYPWDGDGSAAVWWKNRTDETLPLVADMTPKQGTGKPARNVTPASAPSDARTWNSGNHKGDGQNVGFGDGHAEFMRRPDIGQDNDNIYSMAGTLSRRGAQFGGIAAGVVAPDLRAGKPPFDIVMLPVRDETTGGM